MQCLYVDAYDSGINTALQRVFGSTTGEMGILLIYQTRWSTLDKVVPLWNTHPVPPLWCAPCDSLWLPRNYKMHEHTIPHICISISNHMQYLKYIINICNLLF